MGKKTRYHAKEEQQIEKKTRQEKILTNAFDLLNVIPSTQNQENAFHSYFNGQNLILSGVAGTGKSFISLYLALNDVKQGLYKHIYVIKSIVSTKEVGFLPGSINEKIMAYETPYFDLVGELLQDRNAYNTLKAKNIISFHSTSFLRGITFRDSIIIIDEAQNLSFHELDTIITRLGDNCKLIIIGDEEQNDLQMHRQILKSGFSEVIKICSSMKSFDIINFEIKDIVRSGLVRQYLLAKYLQKK